MNSVSTLKCRITSNFFLLSFELFLYQLVSTESSYFCNEKIHQASYNVANEGVFGIIVLFCLTIPDIFQKRNEEDLYHESLRHGSDEGEDFFGERSEGRRCFRCRVGNEHADQVDQIYSDAGNSICHSCCPILPIFQHKHQPQQQESVHHHVCSPQHASLGGGKDYGPLGQDELKVLHAGQHYEQPCTEIIKQLGLVVVVEVLPQGVADVRLISEVLEVYPGRKGTGSSGDDDSNERSYVSSLHGKNREEKDQRTHHSVDEAEHCLCRSDCLL